MRRATVWGLVLTAGQLVAATPGTAFAKAAETPPAAAGPALARPPGAALLNQRVDWDGEPASVTVSSEGLVSVQSGSQEPLAVRLPGPAKVVRSARAEVATAGDTRYLLVKLQTVDSGQRLVVVGKVGARLATVYAGPVGPVGRDGEYSIVIEATPQGLLRYQRVPGLQRCDGEDRLFSERYQGSAGWQPAPELTVPTLGDAPVLTATTPVTGGAGAAPGNLGAPIGVYRFVGASAQVGVQRADLLAAPRELEDGKPATAWRVPADARGAFVTARADGAGHSVHALRIVPAAASQGALPRQLALLLDGKQRLTIDLSPAARDSAAQWVQLPTPIATSCLSLVITVPAPGGQPAALGKVAIYSELDADTSDAGLRRLAERAASTDFASGEAALRTLRAFVERERSREPKTAGRATALLKAIDAVLPSAQGTGRRRLQETLRSLVGGPPWPELAETLVHAIVLAEPAERPALWSALGQLGAGSEAGLLQLAGEVKLGTAGRAEALQRLGALATPGALQALLQMATAEPTPQRELQRSVIGGLGAALHCRPEGDPLLTAALAALPGPSRAAPGELAAGKSGPPRGGTALLVEALGLALTDCSPAVRSRLSHELLGLWPALGAAAPDGTPSAGKLEQADFVLRYRILQSLERLDSPTEESAQLLFRVLAGEAEPILRQAAARAAVTGHASAEQVTKAVGQALADADPGVRLAVLSAVGERHLATVLPATEQALRSDRWPLVRRAAVDSRAAQCPAVPPVGQTSPRVAALRQAVSDADEQVQRLALAGLGRCEAAGAIDVYTAQLKDGQAAPALRSQACALLVRHGFSAAEPVQQQAHATIAATLLELLSDPAADERSAGTVISCTRAIGELGDPRDFSVLLHTSTAPPSEVPPPIRQSALEAIAKLCTRTPALPAALRKDLASGLQSATKDPEERVAGAAQRAQARCR